MADGSHDAPKEDLPKVSKVTGKTGTTGTIIVPTLVEYVDSKKCVFPHVKSTSSSPF